LDRHLRAGNPFLGEIGAGLFPAYMIPKFLPLLDILPKAWTDKIDYQKLKTSAKNWF
jgi:hypothetical protein